jgi:uncharacterized protein (DUF1778 family)
MTPSSTVEDRSRESTATDDLILSRDAFDRLVAELEQPIQPVPALVQLFTRHPKLPDR